MDALEFGQIIKQHRKQHKLSQTQLGELIGLSKSAISKYENGEIKKIPLGIAMEFMFRLEISPYDFPAGVMDGIGELSFYLMYRSTDYKMEQEGRPFTSLHLGKDKDFIVINKQRLSGSEFDSILKYLQFIVSQRPPEKPKQ